MADVLPALLRDRAADFWEELPADTQKSYHHTKEALLEHFLPPEARHMYYTDLYNRIQRRREPVADFARAIQDMIRQAYSTMSAADQDILCCEHFLHGLRPNLKRLVLVANPKSFTEAVSAAKREECNDQIVSGTAPTHQLRHLRKIFLIVQLLRYLRYLLRGSLQQCREWKGNC